MSKIIVYSSSNRDEREIDKYHDKSNTSGRDSESDSSCSSSSGWGGGGRGYHSRAILVWSPCGSFRGILGGNKDEGCF